MAMMNEYEKSFHALYNYTRRCTYFDIREDSYVVLIIYSSSSSSIVTSPHTSYIQ